MFEDDGLYVSGIEKSYNSRQILKGLTIGLKKGESVALLGPNGAGKTTCFYTFVGLVSPDKGKVVLNNTDITKYPIYMRGRAGISYLPQEPSIFRSLSVADNIMAILEVVEDVKSVRLDMLEKLMDGYVEQTDGRTCWKN